MNVRHVLASVALPPVIAPLPDDMIVVRGGQDRDPDSVLQKVNDAVRDGDEPVLSVYCGVAGPDETEEEVIERVCREGDIPHGTVQVSTVGALSQGRPFVLTQETADGEPECHHHAHFGDGYDRDRAQDFIDRFGEPILNPTGGKQRRRT